MKIHIWKYNKVSKTKKEKLQARAPICTQNIQNPKCTYTQEHKVRKEHVIWSVNVCRHLLKCNVTCMFFLHFMVFSLVYMINLLLLLAYLLKYLIDIWIFTQFRQAVNGSYKSIYMFLFFENVQYHYSKPAHKYLSDVLYNPVCTHLQTEQKWLTFSERVKYHTAQLVLKTKCNSLPTYMNDLFSFFSGSVYGCVRSIATRNYLNIPKSRTHYIKYYFQ